MSVSDEGASDDSFVTQRDPRLRIPIPMVVDVALPKEQLHPTIITTAIPDRAASLNITPVRMNRAVTT